MIIIKNAEIIKKKNTLTSNHFLLNKFCVSHCLRQQFMLRRFLYVPLPATTCNTLVIPPNTMIGIAANAMIGIAANAMIGIAAL